MNTFILHTNIIASRVDFKCYALCFPILSIKLMSVFTVDQGTARVSF